MTRAKCPAADVTGDRHMVTTSRWTLTSPDGCTVELCSAACLLTWICAALPTETTENLALACA